MAEHLDENDREIKFPEGLHRSPHHVSTNFLPPAGEVYGYTEDPDVPEQVNVSVPELYF